MRRSLLALLISLAAHLLVVAIAVAVSVWRTMSLVPAIQLQTVTVEVKDLPLGGPPVPKAEDKQEPSPRKPRSRRRASAHRGVVLASPKDAGAEPNQPDAGRSFRPIDGGTAIDGGRRQPGDLRESGPEGSRLIALLRLDRLRATPGNDKTIAAIDQLLVLLPDRRRLIEDTGLDLYRDFDCLIVATPNPADDAVTFLAVRHHLTDRALRAGLERGARAAGKPVEWLTLGGRPVGLRRGPAGATPIPFDRDDRILALPQAHLAIMATPAYATLLLGTDPRAWPGQATDGGAPDALPPAKARPKPVARVRWQEVAARIEAQEAALPDDATFMMMTTGLFAPVVSPTGTAAPTSQGRSNEKSAQTAGGTSNPPPQTVTLVIGLDPAHIAISAEFASEADAERWERALPHWRRRLLGNPLAILGGYASLIERTEISREGNTLHVHAVTTPEELQRLLSLTANLTRAAQQARRR